MIEIPAFILILCGFSFAVVWCADAVASPEPVTCKCGRHRADNPIIFDPSDRQRIVDLLSELCPVCRSQRTAGVVPVDHRLSVCPGAEL